MSPKAFAGSICAICYWDEIDSLYEQGIGTGSNSETFSITLFWAALAAPDQCGEWSPATGGLSFTLGGGGGTMAKAAGFRHLSVLRGEYVQPKPNGSLDRQAASARWEFILALDRVVPDVLQKLRDEVYPKFAAEQHKGTPRVPEFTPSIEALLSDWARHFHLDSAPWIITGAKTTLARWHRAPAMLDRFTSPDDPQVYARNAYRGFYTPVAEYREMSDAETRFNLDDPGWDPKFQPFAEWREYMESRFKEALRQYEARVRALALERGLIKVPLYTREHFEWLALFQCGNLSLEQIRFRYPLVGDNSAISKGMHTAAETIGVSVRKRQPKLKS
jgi:hypothetical protein